MSIAETKKIAELEARVAALEAALNALADRVGPVAKERVDNAKRKTLTLNG